MTVRVDITKAGATVPPIPLYYEDATDFEVVNGCLVLLDQSGRRIVAYAAGDWFSAHGAGAVATDSSGNTQ